MSPSDLACLDTGNRIMRTVIKLARQCQRFNVPWAIENPEKSLCWMTSTNQNKTRRGNSKKKNRPDRRPRIYLAAHHFTCAGANRLLSSVNSCSLIVEVYPLSTTHSTFFHQGSIFKKKKTRPETCFTPQPMPCPGCLSTRVTSVCWLDDPLREPRLWNSSVMSRASCKYFASLHSRSVTPQDSAWVALAVSLTRWPSFPRLSLSSPSSVNRYFVARRHRSLWDLVQSWASDAFRFSSTVFLSTSSNQLRAESRRCWTC